MDSPPGTPPDRPNDGDATWSIADVERDTGLGKDTLRVWERRYGFPLPSRDGLGERAYPPDQVRRLRVIKRLLDAGHRPGKVVPLPFDELQALVALGGPAGRAGAARASVAPAAGLLQDLASPWLGWLAADRTDAVRQALQQHILRHGLGPTVEDLVAPLCVLVGDAWLRGELSVYQEHLFTETLQTVLREAIASLDASGQGLARQPRVLLTTTPGEQHGLGLLMAECHFALESCARFVLGVSTPVADIVLAARQLRVDVLALSFSAHASRRDLVDSLRQLQDQLPEGVEVWVGGSAAAAHRRALPERVVVMRRASDVSAQVQAWRERRTALTPAS
ncbi:MerR family transcriptional regulator [Ramlibacter sp. MAHUQ-53]|uniref:MerR family transcriptional regulator n=1 Tax=unclassified Ramlibacter TaxID=2617605 RepID=UPI00364538C3